jgi:succinate dehydrogenase/fumarate reductase flavoprotein subunit
MRMAGLSAEFVVTMLAENAAAAGVDIRYKVVAKQLVREDNNTGRVSAVIAQGEDGTYTKYVGAKGIIMATGDFSANREMMAKYCPMVLPLLTDAGDRGYDNSFKFGGLFKGDGQQMGLWAGAAWQRTFPNAPMIMGKWIGSNQPYGTHRGLLVNRNGERFTNEDINGPFEGWAQIREPDMTAYAIWDVNYAEAGAPWHVFGMVEGADPIPPENMVSAWEAYVEQGTYVKGETVEEVIEQLGLPVDATKATIDRYNELVAGGEDLDFHKRASTLASIAQGPFYGGILNVPDFLTVMGGLRTNVNMQVCDANDQPIPGLYNIGTMVGDYYANIYNYMIAGNNLGACCLTFGYLTGRDIALA